MLVLTIFVHSICGDDGDCYHDEPGGTPHVLHEELLQLDVPQTLPDDFLHLGHQLLIGLLEERLLHLEVTTSGKSQQCSRYSSHAEMATCKYLFTIIQVSVLECVDKYFLLKGYYIM